MRRKLAVLLLALTAAMSSGCGTFPPRARERYTQKSKRGTTYYVDGSATNAADTNPGTAEQPWKTISRAGIATNELKPGDTVLTARAWRSGSLANRGDRSPSPPRPGRGS